MNHKQQYFDIVVWIELLRIIFLSEIHFFCFSHEIPLISNANARLPIWTVGVGTMLSQIAAISSAKNILRRELQDMDWIN